MSYLKDVYGLFGNQNDGGGYCRFLVNKSRDAKYPAISQT